MIAQDCAVRRAREVDSTNRWAAREAVGGAPTGTLFVADAQTAGRGRNGRAWASEGMGLYMSLLLRPAMPARDAPRLTMLAAVAICRAARAAGADAAIKWPNDIVAGGRKLCGILCESRARGLAMDWCVLGTGINLAQAEGDFPDDLRGRATSLRIETGREIAREAFIAAYLEAVAEWYDDCVADGDGFFDEYGKRLLTLGRRVRVIEQDAQWEGEAVGIRRDGALEVRTSGGVRAVYAGDVSVRGPGGYI